MKRTTYAEKHSRWIYDWPAILHNIEHGLFTDREAKEWYDASFSWVTCACGNQCADIPRYSEDSVHRAGLPLDYQLRDLGATFCWQIEAALDPMRMAERATYIAEARATLAAIEKRAAELLKEIGE